jgi:hypothetical protein
MSRAVPRFHRTNAPLPGLAVPAYRVTVFYLVDQQICLWNQDYIMTNATQQASSEANIANTFYAAVVTPLRACLSSDCTFTAVKATCLTQPSRMPSTFNVLPANQAGTVAGTHVPSEVAAIISKLSGVKGQHGRGRLYLPGIPSSFLAPGTDANRWTAAAMSAFAALSTAIFSNTIADGTNNAIAGLTTRVLRGLPVTNGATLTSQVQRALAGVIRRRRIGRGK